MDRVTTKAAARAGAAARAAAGAIRLSRTAVRVSIMAEAARAALAAGRGSTSPDFTRCDRSKVTAVEETTAPTTADRARPLLLGRARRAT